MLSTRTRLRTRSARQLLSVYVATQHHTLNFKPHGSFFSPAHQESLLGGTVVLPFAVGGLEGPYEETVSLEAARGLCLTSTSGCVKFKR